MSDILNEAQAVLQCKSCHWYKNCVLPMRFSEEDLRRQLESSMPGATAPGAAQYGMQQLLSSLAAAAENSLLEGCPVFISRLRTNPKLAEQIKELMRQWSNRSEGQTS
ncbi:MAG: hypothetical protein FJ013_02395 [Chloroflexi bacterium]|nr:hypothetical protein [Chloroflexota bacterium]MBM4453415.1 hypothetical protein [Chloroflexota bacterium]